MVSSLLQKMLLRNNLALKLLKQEASGFQMLFFDFVQTNFFFELFTNTNEAEALSILCWGILFVLRLLLRLFVGVGGSSGLGLVLLSFNVF